MSTGCQVLTFRHAASEVSRLQRYQQLPPHAELSRVEHRESAECAAISLRIVRTPNKQTFKDRDRVQRLVCDALNLGDLDCVLSTMCSTLCALDLVRYTVCSSLCALHCVLYTVFSLRALIFATFAQKANPLNHPLCGCRGRSGFPLTEQIRCCTTLAQIPCGGTV